MNWKKLLLGILAALGGLTLIVVACLGAAWWYFHPSVEREGPYVYAQRHGHDLTLEVVHPSDHNGYAVLFMVSGGWESDPGVFQPWMVAPLLRRGYTVVPVSHLSQPEATVMEIFEDVRTAVRFVRLHAKDYGITHPGRLGVMGASSGGNLSLLLATRGEPGDPTAEEALARQSSAVQAAAVFCPVTDLLDLSGSTEDPGDGGPPISFPGAFGPDTDNPEVWQRVGRSVSPLFHVNENLPPVLILHGDADTLVPIGQSERFVKAAHEAGVNPVKIELRVKKGKDHAWLSMPWDERRFADWFDNWLREQ